MGTRLKLRYVFDMDSGEEPRIIARFKQEDAQKTLEMFERDPRWEDVSVDRYDDIILWEKL